MKKVFACMFSGLVFIAVSCGQPQAKGEGKLTDTAMTDTETPDSQSVSGVLSAYINLKNRLVQSDADGGKKAAEALKQQLADVQGCAAAANEADAIAGAKNIDEQRKAFVALSKDIIPLAKGFKTTDTMYVAYCPMANSNKGAYWLSEIREIKNPYFGDDMLTCGEVKSVLNK